jgi:quinohemoprotein ethanol dehydrogenase
MATAPMANSPIQAAPAFTVQQLLAPPKDAWITNGGTLYNQRWSPLTLLNRDNVKDLKALWRTAMGSGTSQGHAGQAQILAYADTVPVAPDWKS